MRSQSIKTNVWEIIKIAKSRAANGPAHITYVPKYHRYYAAGWEDGKSNVGAGKLGRG